VLLYAAVRAWLSVSSGPLHLNPNPNPIDMSERKCPDCGSTSQLSDPYEDCNLCVDCQTNWFDDYMPKQRSVWDIPLGLLIKRTIWLAVVGGGLLWLISSIGGCDDADARVLEPQDLIERRIK